jgi:hypothetical protein
MTFPTIFPTLVFGFEIFPVIHIAEAVEIVSETLAMHPEIIRHHEVPDNQKQGDGGQHQP